MAGKTRDSNIELLRILTICGVVVLHYNGNVAFNSVNPSTANYYLLYALEALFICAVDLFVLISGYFLSTSDNRRTVKALELLMQVMAIGAVKYLGVSIATGQGISLRSLIGAVLPNNYFVTFYVTVYLFSPYINKVLNQLDRKRFEVLLGLSMIIFAVWPTLLDLGTELTGISFSGMYTTNTGGSQYGYSVINFALMYLIGAWLRRFDVGQKTHKTSLTVGLICCIGVIFVMQMRFPQIARAYCNPFVIAEGVLIFLLFKKSSLRSRTVNALAKGAFTCFLLHDAFLPFIGIEKVVNDKLLILLGHLTVSMAGIFLICWIVWRIYDWITAPVFGWIGKKLTPIDKLFSFEEEK